MKYKAIFIDIDGTLRNNNHEVTKRTIEAVQKTTKEIPIILCSGRNRGHTKRISEICGASPYIVSNNGGDVYHYQEKKVIYQSMMQTKACEKLYEIALKNDTRIVMGSGDNKVVNRLKENEDIEVLLTQNIEEFLKENIVTQCVISDENYEKIRNMGSEVQKVENITVANESKCLKDSHIKPSGTIYYDVVDKNTSKGKAVWEMCKHLGISPKETIAIGDSYNDISMFQNVGYRVAMGNAIPELKEKADEIVQTNEEDGVARFLESLFQ